MKGIRFAIMTAIAAAVFTRAAGAADGKADLIWVVDASVGSGRDGGDERIRGFIAGATALYSCSISTVTVLKYGGFTETQVAGLVAIEKTGVPADVAGRIAFLKTFTGSLGSALQFVYSGSDLNAACSVSGGLLEMLAADDVTRPGAVIVFVSGSGRTDAIETMLFGDETRVVARKEYLDGAARNSGDVNRESVNVEAERVFKDEVLPALNRLPRIRTVSVLTGAGAADGPMAAISSPEAPLVLDTDALARIESVFAAAFTAAGAAVRRPFAAESAGFDAGSVSRPVAVHAGVTEMTMAVMSAAAFSVRWRDPSGALLEQGDGFGAFGSDRFSVLVFSSPVSGGHSLEVVPAAPGSASCGLSGYRVVGYDVVAEAALPDSDLYSGMVVPVRVAVVSGDPPSPVTDPETLAQIEVEIRVTAPSGAVEVIRSGLANLPDSVLEVPVKLGDGDWEGEALVSAVAVAFPGREDGVSPEFESKPTLLRLTVLRGGTRIEVQFLATESFAGQGVGLSGRLVDGKAPSGPVEARLVNDKTGKETLVTLFAGTSPAELSGSAALSEHGVWKITGSSGQGKPVVTPGKMATLSVRERKIATETKDQSGAFASASELVADWYEALPVDREQGGLVFAAIDLDKSEKAMLKVTATPAGPWSLKLYSGDKEVPAGGLEVTGQAPRAEIRVVAEPSGRQEAGDYPAGKILFELIIPPAGAGESGLSVKSEIPVKARVIPVPPPWFMNPLLWAAAGAALVLLVILVWAFTGPKFEYQSLILQGEAGVEKAPFFFVDNAYGFKKRNALGTYELAGAVRVRARSGGRCAISALANDVEVRVNGHKVTGAFELAEGNLVQIAREGQSLSYRYSNVPVAPTDLHDDEFVLMEFDEDDDFVIADDDVPEYVPTGAAPAPSADAAPHGWVDDSAAATAEEAAADGLDDLIDSKPSVEMITATPVPMDGAAAAFDEGQTLFDLADTGMKAEPESVTKPAAQPDSGSDKTLFDMPDLVEEASEEPAQVQHPPAEDVPFDESATLMSFKLPPKEQRGPAIVESGAVEDQVLGAVDEGFVAASGEDEILMDVSSDGEVKDNSGDDAVDAGDKGGLKAVSLDEMADFLDMGLKADEGKPEEPGFDDMDTFLGKPPKKGGDADGEKQDE